MEEGYESRQVWKFVSVVLVAVVPVERWAGRRAVHRSTGCLCLARHGQWRRHLRTFGELGQRLGTDGAPAHLPLVVLSGQHRPHQPDNTARLGKIPTSSVRRFTARFSRSSVPRE